MATTPSILQARDSVALDGVPKIAFDKLSKYIHDYLNDFQQHTTQTFQERIYVRISGIRWLEYT